MLSEWCRIALHFFFSIPLDNDFKTPIFFPAEVTHQYARQWCEFLDMVLVCGHYESALKRTIRSFKYEDHKELVEIFVPPMTEILRYLELDSNDCILTAIPIGFDRLVSRWFNQSVLLSKRLSQELRIPYRKTLFRWFSFTHQAHLSRDLRKMKKNPFHIWKANAHFVRGKNIIIIDDVISTGTTLDEAACTLKAFWAKRVIAACIARGN